MAECTCDVQSARKKKEIVLSDTGLRYKPEAEAITEGASMAEGRDIAAEVRRIIKDQLDVDEKDIKPESTFIDDLGADSLGLVELVLAFEEAFEIDIPDEDTEKIRTVQDAVEYIEKNAKK
jgi:acyl carrier protein